MPPDFLNSREDALALWAVVVLAFSFYKAPREIGTALLGVFHALIHPKLLLLFGAAVVYCGLVIYAAKELGLWHTTALKETIYWFVGTGVVLVGDAVARANPSDPRFLRRVLRRVVGVTILIEVIVNLYVLPFSVEFVLLFVVLTFVGLQVVARHDESVAPRVRTVIDGVLATVGVFYVSYFLARAIGDLDGFVSRERTEDFLVPLALTVMLIPFLYGVAWVSRYDQEKLRERWRSASNSAA